MKFDRTSITLILRGTGWIQSYNNYIQVIIILLISLGKNAGNGIMPGLNCK